MNRRLTRTVSEPRRGVNRAEAARFVGSSPSLFDRMVDDGRMPKPTTVDGEEIFDLIELDHSFDRLHGGHQQRSPWK